VNKLFRFSSGTIGAAIRLRAVWSYTLPSDCRGDSQFVTTVRRIIGVVPDMIGDILDACREVLEINGDPQSAYWLASQMVEMRMWWTSEHDVRGRTRQGHRHVGRSVDVRENGKR